MSKVKNQRLEIRLSEDELNALNANAAAQGMSRGRFIVLHCVEELDEFALLKERINKMNERLVVRSIRNTKAVTSDSKKNTERINMRVSKIEKEALKQLAAQYDKSVTDYLIWKALSGDTAIYVADTQPLQATLLELKRQGNNVNQIAAALNDLRAQINSSMFIGSYGEDMKHQINRKLETIEKDCQVVADSHRKALQATQDTLDKLQVGAE